MFTHTVFQRLAAVAALAVCGFAAPTGAFAQDTRYVPGYEPSYVPSGYSLLGAYGLSSVDPKQMSESQDVKISSADSNIKPVTLIDLVARQTLVASDLEFVSLSGLNMRSAAPVAPILIAWNR